MTLRFLVNKLFVLNVLNTHTILLQNDTLTVYILCVAIPLTV